jgi:ABC-type hemin transport system ATPase subunit
MAHDDEAALQVSELKVTLEDQVVIADVSFSLRPGQVLAILGPNGAGLSSQA